MNRLLVPALFSAAVSGVFAPANAEETKRTATQVHAMAHDNFVWQSRNSNLSDLSSEFGQLYGALLLGTKYGVGIETYAYQGNTTRNLESIMREEKLIAGTFFPNEADLFVCQLNPSICRIVAKKNKRSAKWTNKPADKVLLPKLNFERVIVHREYPKKTGQKLESIVVSERGGCEQYDEACRKYVANLNRVPMDALEGDYEGPVLVPTLAYRTHVTFTKLPTAGRSSTATGKAVQEVLRNRPNMTRSIVPDVFFKMQGAQNHPSDEGSRKRILELISHPFAHNARIPGGHLLIGVFDTWLDPTHCDIARVIKSYVNQGEKPSGIDSGKPCGTPGDASEPFDHGTHVVGLLAASATGKSGPGINPNARIYFVRINPQAMKSDDAGYLTQVAERLNAIYEDERVEVVNLSFQYPFPQGLNDTFLSAIGQHRKVTLFVAAAGNDKQELRSGSVCTIRPACGGDPNLITVASLDLSADHPALDSSNFGSAVHIAAPGKNVLSTISGGRVGRMSGTSQAAPLVAGAASLLLMLNPKLYPEQVKNRLIYTSDLFPSLYKKVLGGRLNVSRALAFESAQLSLAGGRSLQGQVVNLDAELALFDTETGKPIFVRWSHVRRLKYDRQAGKYTMFWKPTDEGSLKRSFVTPQNSKQEIQMNSEQSKPSVKNYNLKEVYDYVAAIPQDAQ